MDRGNRLNDLRRLAADMGAEPTERQLEALLDVLPPVGDHAWAMGLRLACAEKTFPTRMKLSKLLSFEAAKDRHPKVRLPDLPGTPIDAEYGHLRMAIVVRIQSHGLMPGEVADMLEALIPRFPEQALGLDREIMILRSAPKSWAVAHALTLENARLEAKRRRGLSVLPSGGDRG